jgi:hypothetical protein
VCQCVRTAAACVTAGLTFAGGCAAAPRNLVDVFPPAAVAAPWHLDGSVWTGSIDQAAAGLGEDADAWRQSGATRVWLAVYRHEQDPQRRLTARAFAFESSEAARQACQRFCPPKPTEFHAGDGGCWTGIGVLFVCGRVVFEIFGQEASWQNEIHSAAVAGHIVSRMPPELAASPR